MGEPGFSVDALFSVEGMSLVDVDGFDKDAGPDKKHGPGWCAYHKVNHKPSTKCPYKDKPVNDMSSLDDEHSTEKLKGHVPEHTLDALKGLVEKIKGGAHVSMALAKVLLENGGLSYADTDTVIKTLFEKGILKHNGVGGIELGPVPGAEKPGEPVEEPAEDEKAPEPAPKGEEPTETPPEPKKEPKHPKSITEIPLPASLGLSGYETTQTHKVLSWIASKVTVAPSALTKVLGKAGVPYSKIPAVEKHLKDIGAIVSAPGGKIAVGPLEKINLDDTETAAPPTTPGPADDKAPGTVSDALKSVGLQSYTEAAKGISFLEKTGGFHSVQDVIKAAALTLPPAYAHMNLGNILTNRFEQLVSKGFLEKSSDGKYAWKGKGNQAPAEPAPKPIEPTPAAPVLDPGTKALDAISSINGTDDKPLTDKQVQAAMQALATTITPAGITMGIPMSVLSTALGKAVLDASPDGGASAWPEDISQLGGQLCDALEEAGLIKTKGMNMFSIPPGVTGKAIGEFAKNKPAPATPEAPVAPPEPVPAPEVPAPVAPPAGASATPLGGKALIPKLLGKIPAAFGELTGAIAKVLSAEFSKPSASVGAGYLQYALKSVAQAYGSKDLDAAAGAYQNGLENAGVIEKKPDGSFKLADDLTNTAPETPPAADAKPTGKCPDGHATYKSPLPHNCPSCGKVMQPTAAANPADLAAAKKKLEALETLKEDIGDYSAHKDSILQNLVDHGELSSDQAKSVFQELVAHGVLAKSGFKYYQNKTEFKNFLDDAKKAATPLPEEVAAPVPPPAQPAPAPAAPPPVALTPHQEQIKKALDNVVIPGGVTQKQIDVVTNMLTKQVASFKTTGVTKETVALAFGQLLDDTSALDTGMTPDEKKSVGTTLVSMLILGDALVPNADGKLVLGPALGGAAKPTPPPAPVAPPAPPAPVPPPAPGAGLPALLSKMPDILGAAKDTVVKKLQELFPTGSETLDIADLYKAIKKSILDGGGTANPATAFDMLEESGVIAQVPGSGGNDYKLGDDVKSLLGTTPAAPSPTPPVPVVAPVENVPTDDEVGTTLGWNSKGKGIALLKALNTNGAAGISIEEALEKVPADKKPSLGVAKHMLDEAIEAGFVKRVPGSKPAKWLFTKHPPAAPGTPAPAVPPPPVAPPASPAPSAGPGPKQLADALLGANLPLAGGAKLSQDQAHALAGSLAAAFAKHGDPSGAVMLAEIKNAIGGSLADQQAVLQGMLDKGLVNKKIDGHYVTKADFFTGANPDQKPEEPTGTCPSGHKTYQSPVPHNCPSCGKVMAPSTGAGSGADAAAQKAAVVAKIPKTAADFPDPAALQLTVADASAVGGKKDKSIFKDPATGVEYMFKPNSGESGWRAEISAAFANIASKLAGPDSVVPVKVVDIPGHGKGSLQPWRPDAVADLTNVDMKKLNDGQKKDLQQERVLDWLMSSHDTKGDNFLLLNSGKILGVDKEQAFRFINNDKLSLSYKPNPGADPVYNRLYSAYANGSLDLDLNEIEPLISKIEALPDADYLAMLGPTLDKLAVQHTEWGGNTAAAKQKILARKQNMRKDFEQFFTQLQNARGIPGPFTFKPGGAKAPVPGPSAPVPGPAPVPTPTAPASPVTGPATSTPVSAGIPNLSAMQKVEGKIPPGGTKAKAYYQVPGSDQLYIFKPAPKKFRAAIQQAAGDLAGMITDPGDTIPVKMVDENGQLGSLQPEITTSENLANFDLTKLSPAQYSDLLRERVVDWALGNHDSHSKNLVVTPTGKILGVDKEQAFKTVGKDQLSDTYAPNTAEYGEQPPAYNKLFQLYKSGQVNLNLNDALKTIQRVEAVPDDVWMQTVEPYLSEFAKDKGPAAAEQKRAAILERKKNIRKDFEQFFTKLQNEKGVPGPFTFGASSGVTK